MIDVVVYIDLHRVHLVHKDPQDTLGSRGRLERQGLQDLGDSQVLKDHLGWMETRDFVERKEILYVCKNNAMVTIISLIP